MISTLLVSFVLSGSSPDAVAAAWKQRAERATQKLAGPGLDECDTAVEVAFQNARVQDKGPRRTYALQIKIGNEAMLLSYSYVGARVDDFWIASLPRGWMAHQPASNKTLSVVLSSAPGCAFDLCTNDPMSEGPCKDGGK